MSDDRSDGESSDAEFEAIVKIDTILKEVWASKNGNDVLKLHEDIFALMENIEKIQDMVQLDHFREVFEEVIAPELLEITNYEKLLVFAR